MLEIVVSDYTDLSDPLNSYNRTFECNVDPSMSIHDFKRFVLYLLENRPFFLEFNCQNSQQLLELINLGSISEFDKCKKQAKVKVFMNLDQFDLVLEQVNRTIPKIEVKRV